MHILTLTRSSLMSSHIRSHSRLFRRFSSFFIAGIRNEYIRLNGSLFLRSRQRLPRAEAFLISSFISLFFCFHLLVNCPSFLSISIFHAGIQMHEANVARIWGTFSTIFFISFSLFYFHPFPNSTRAFCDHAVRTSIIRTLVIRLFYFNPIARGTVAVKPRLNEFFLFISNVIRFLK